MHIIYSLFIGLHLGVAKSISSVIDKLGQFDALRVELAFRCFHHKRNVQVELVKNGFLRRNAIFEAKKIFFDDDPTRGEKKTHKHT